MTTTIRNFFNSLFGKLFCGFFTVIVLTAVTALGVGYAVSNRQNSEVGVLEWHFIGQRSVADAVSVYEFAGLNNLKRWIQSPRGNRRLAIYVVNEHGEDLAGRQVPSKALEQLRAVQKQSAAGPIPDSLADSWRTVEIDGQPWTFFSVRKDPFPVHIKPPFPTLPLVLSLSVSVTISLFLAWLLARFYTRNLQKLNRAMRHLADGELNTRVSEQLGTTDTEVVNLASVFDSMASRIQALINKERRLFHDVSHEIRSPLARIDVALELVRRTPDKTERHLDRIQKEVNTINDLVENLLTYARLENAEHLSKSPVSLTEIIRTVAEDADFEGQKKAVSVVTEMPDEELLINADGSLIARALENFTRNAMRYSPAGTAVRLTLRKESDGLRVLCTDQGPGMKEEDLATMFDPFVRGSDVATGSGFGLGLAIARRAVTQHGGTISAKNRPEGGLEVSVFLPASLLL